jgi:transposase
MRPYSLDLRERVLKDCDAGMATAAVARKYAVSPAWVRRLKQRRRQTGQVAPQPQRHGPRPAWETLADRIRVAVHQAPDLTLREYIERFALPLSKSALARGLIALGLSRKKSRSGPASKTVRT